MPLAFIEQTELASVPLLRLVETAVPMFEARDHLSNVLKSRRPDQISISPSQFFLVSVFLPKNKKKRPGVGALASDGLPLEMTNVRRAILPQKSAFAMHLSVFDLSLEDIVIPKLVLAKLALFDIVGKG